MAVPGGYATEYERPDGYGGGVQVIMSRQHTEKEWNAMYPYIVRLYIGEQRTLGEVMHIMETQFRFKATQSMYKKRIGRWQLHKYKRRRRPEQGESTTTVAGSEGIRPARRNELVRIAPQAVFHRPLPAQPPDVDVDREIVSLLSNMQRLTFMQQGPDGGVGRGEVTEEDVGLAPSGILAVSQLSVTFTLGSALFARGQGQLAGKAVRRAFLMLEDIVRHAHFGLDWLLIDLLYDFATRGQEALYATLVAHLAAVAEALLPPHHPVRLIADQLLRYGDRDRYGNRHDLATLLQRLFYSKIDTVQSDGDARTALFAQNRRISQLLIPGPTTPRILDPEREEIVKLGIQATHYELEWQKEPPEGRKKQHQQRKMTKPLSPPYSPPSSSSSLSSSSSSSPPRLPSPTPSFASTSGGGRDTDAFLPDFIAARTRRSYDRMSGGGREPDELTLRVADRLFFSEYSPELAEIYELKGRAYKWQTLGNWTAATQAQYELLDVMREKTGLDVWGIIRELWALEKILITRGGASEDEFEAIRLEIDARARGLLDAIPDDAP